MIPCLIAALLGAACGVFFAFALAVWWMREPG
jgi:hypothetical protein